MKRYRPQSEEGAPLSGVNIIPVIDVSLVLLIILLATSPILNLRPVRRERPFASRQPL